MNKRVHYAKLCFPWIFLQFPTTTTTTMLYISRTGVTDEVIFRIYIAHDQEIGVHGLREFDQRSRSRRRQAILNFSGAGLSSFEPIDLCMAGSPHSLYNLRLPFFRFDSPHDYPRVKDSKEHFFGMKRPTSRGRRQEAASNRYDLNEMRLECA